MDGYIVKKNTHFLKIRAGCVWTAVIHKPLLFWGDALCRRCIYGGLKKQCAVRTRLHKRFFQVAITVYRLETLWLLETDNPTDDSWLPTNCEKTAVTSKKQAECQLEMFGGSGGQLLQM